MIYYVKVLPFALFLVFVSMFASAQSPNFQWAKQLGGNLQDVSNSITIDDSGNVYITGAFRGACDFDPGINTSVMVSAGEEDHFISKLNDSGSFVWARRMGGTSSDLGLSIAVDDVGNIYTTGYFEGTADFDPGIDTFLLVSEGSRDIFISKLDASGNFVWAKGLGSPSDDDGSSLVLDDSGNLYITGKFSDSVDFDPGPSTSYLKSDQDTDPYVLKLDTAGNLIWVKHFGGTRGIDIFVDDSFYVYTTGTFATISDFDPGVDTFNLFPTGHYDTFISKLDSGGNFIWAKQLGGSGNQTAHSVVVDDSGSVYTAGFFNGNADFDPGVDTFELSDKGRGDIFISKIDAYGDFKWAKQFGSTSLMINSASSLALDNAGNIYSIGGFTGNVDFDPDTGIFNLSSLGPFDIFILKLSSSGDFIWVTQLGSSGTDYGSSIFVDSLDNIYTTGHFAGTVDFNPTNGVANMSSFGAQDVFIHKMSSCHSRVTITPSACDSYMVPSGKETYTISGIYMDTLANAQSCDSIITINLTINQPTTSSPVVNGCDSFQWHGRIFHASGTYFDTISNAAACDSAITLNLTINRSSASTQNILSCSDFLWQGNTYSTTGTYYDTIPNVSGCDSVMMLNLVINRTASTLIDTACDVYFWQGQTYTSSGTYYDTIPNAQGCDSAMTLLLNVKNSTASSQTVISCDSFLWRGNSYTLSGNYSDTIPNFMGCDSVIILNLTIHNSTGSLQTVTSCNNFFWQGGIYSSSGTYYDTIKNSFGCDSLMTLILTIDTVDISVTVNDPKLTSNAQDASYQWINCDAMQLIPGDTNAIFIATTNGNYAVIVGQTGCADTSVCYLISKVGIAETVFEKEPIIFPNPTDGVIFILFDKATNHATLRISNLYGKVIIEKTSLNSDELELDFSEQASGIYLLEILEKRKIFRAKIIKN